MKAPSNLDIARTQLVLTQPFFASLLMRRKFVLTTAVPTMAISNTGTIFLNPEFMKTLSVRQLMYGLCHEVMHLALGHPQRLHGRDKTKWNYAGDAVINDLLDHCKIGERIPNIVNMPGSREKTTDEVYNSLQDPPTPPTNPRGKPQDQGQGQGQAQGNQSDQGDDPQAGDGEGEDDQQGSSSAPKGHDWMDSDHIGSDLVEEEVMSESEAQAAEAQMKVELAQAAQVAKMRGNLPGVLASFVQKIIESKVLWYEVLERLMQALTQSEYSWRRPNRRFTDYLPSTGRIPRMGKVVIVSDISGSVSPKETAHFGGHLSRIVAECHPEEVHILYTDTRVQKHEEFGPDDDICLSYTSGGGTDMTAAFRYIEKHNIEPEVCIVLTDGETPFGEAQPYPVIWCASRACKPPHGDLINFTVEE
jgi:predicted metal-dependent peptidase